MKDQVNFKGRKFTNVGMSREVVEKFLADGSLVVVVGTWEDGTPAFVRMHIESEKNGNE